MTMVGLGEKGEGIKKTVDGYKIVMGCKVQCKKQSIMLSEISQAVRDKYHMISPLTGT